MSHGDVLAHTSVLDDLDEDFPEDPPAARSSVHNLGPESPHLKGTGNMKLPAATFAMPQSPSGSGLFGVLGSSRPGSARRANKVSPNIARGPGCNTAAMVTAVPQTVQDDLLARVAALEARAAAPPPPAASADLATVKPKRSEPVNISDDFDTDESTAKASSHESESAEGGTGYKPTKTAGGKKTKEDRKKENAAKRAPKEEEDDDDDDDDDDVDSKTMDESEGGPVWNPKPTLIEKAIKLRVEMKLPFVGYIGTGQDVSWRPLTPREKGRDKKLEDALEDARKAREQALEEEAAIQRELRARKGSH